MGKNKKSLLPIKAHYFFFMTGMGCILPYAVVFGKQLGISEVAIGFITSILPFIFLLFKPVFGFFIDYFQDHRKLIFIALLFSTTCFFVLLETVPFNNKSHFSIESSICFNSSLCKNQVLNDHSCIILKNNESIPLDELCDNLNETTTSSVCNIYCEVKNTDSLYYSGTFWTFTLFMSLGSIGYNIANSVSDAICFDMLGEGGQPYYGQQRVWGSAGFGIGAFLGGFLVDKWSSDLSIKDYTPAIIFAAVFGAVDLICCSKLKLPKVNKSDNILKDVLALIIKPQITTFLCFAVCVGFCDSFIMVYLLWYLEDLAKNYGLMGSIKTLQGLTIAAETLGGEIIFFIFSGKILRFLGYGHCLTLCFLAYALRFALLSYLPSPWWVIPVEFFMQGPTFALAYTTIVGYASAISPPGTSATMQGIVAGMDDGLGFIIGGVTGGFLYKRFGGNKSFKIYSGFALMCCLIHCVLHQMFFKQQISIPQVTSSKQDQENRSIYNPPGAAIEITSS